MAVAASLFVPAATLAQPAPPPSSQAAGQSRSDDIIVTGGRERAATLARALARGQVGGVLPRWTSLLCVRMIGMQADAARRFEERVRSIAREAGAPVGGPGCNPNLVVAFSSDARAAAAHLYRRRPAMFANRPVWERDRFVEGDDPVRWWTLTHTENEDGMTPVGTGAEAGIAIEGSATTTLGVPTVIARDASLIRSAAVAAIGGAAVLIDSRDVEGVRLMALADHVAMAALTGVPMRTDYGNGAADTIMGLFDTPQARSLPGMTAADRAYLAELYALPPDRLARHQRGALRASMRDALTAADVEAATETTAP